MRSARRGTRGSGHWNLGGDITRGVQGVVCLHGAGDTDRPGHGMSLKSADAARFTI